MLSRKKIAILTGGCIAASGIPTFRGQDGIWKEKTSYAGTEDPMEICTKRFFAKHPDANWQWHYDFNELAESV